LPWPNVTSTACDRRREIADHVRGPRSRHSMTYEVVVRAALSWSLRPATASTSPHRRA
jgi:hypothetical protein